MRISQFVAAAIVAAHALVAAPALAQFDAQSDGSDGALVIDANTTIDLRNAVTGSWQDPSPTPGAGIYDPSIWAVVFKYSEVSINAGTVSFINHQSGAPVVWLVQGNVTIGVNSVVSLNGQGGGTDHSQNTIPAPGGFAGGRVSTSGFGPGGGRSGISGGGGGYAVNGVSSLGGSAYGNMQIIPLVGGSGGGWGNNRSGGAGGGAILIASSTRVDIEGEVRCQGGSSSSSGGNGGGGGAGGAIRLISNTVRVTGINRVLVDAGAAVYSGSAGRIRIEAHKLDVDSAAPRPNFHPYYTTALPGPLFQDNTTPTLRVVSANGVSVSTDPLAGVQSIDATLRPTASPTPVSILIHAFNVEPGRIVEVKAFQASGNPIVVNSTPLEGNVAFSTATAEISLTPGTPADIVLKVLP